MRQWQIKQTEQTLRQKAGLTDRRSCLPNRPGLVPWALILVIFDCSTPVFIWLYHCWLQHPCFHLTLPLLIATPLFSSAFNTADCNTPVFIWLYHCWLQHPCFHLTLNTADCNTPVFIWLYHCCPLSMPKCWWLFVFNRLRSPSYAGHSLVELLLGVVPTFSTCSPSNTTLQWVFPLTVTHLTNSYPLPSHCHTPDKFLSSSLSLSHT